MNKYSEYIGRLHFCKGLQSGRCTTPDCKASVTELGEPGVALPAALSALACCHFNFLCVEHISAASNADHIESDQVEQVAQGFFLKQKMPTLWRQERQDGW